MKNLYDFNGFDPELRRMVIAEDMQSQYASVPFNILTQRGWDFKKKVINSYDVPWTALKEKLLLVKGELTVISGYTGQGKSEVAINLALHAIEQGAKAYIASSELDGGQIHSRICQHASGCADPTVDFYNAISSYYADKLYIYDKVGYMDLNTILAAGANLNQSLGFDFFVIDNLMMLDKKADDYNKQLENIQILSAFAKEYDVCVLLVAHSRKPQSKAAHGPILRVFSPPGIHEILGASSIGNLIDNHLSVTINYTKKHAMDKIKGGAFESDLSNEEQRSLKEGDTLLLRDKKREFGDYFYQSLYYDPRFRRLKDYESQQCKSYVHYQKDSVCQL